VELLLGHTKLETTAPCRTLRTGQVLLLNPAVPDSFDGRYFGILPASTLLGRASPLAVVSP
jgi:type IV secretory pathway protease TraF